jgi:hypothetical protein
MDLRLFGHLVAWVSPASAECSNIWSTAVRLARVAHGSGVFKVSRVATVPGHLGHKDQVNGNKHRETFAVKKSTAR